MKGTEIIVSAEPRGVFEEGIIDDTSKPGTCMEIVPAAATVSGRHHWRAVSRGTGTKGQIAVLLPDREQGKLFSDAYVSGTRCFLYFPVAGEDMNMLVADQAGTSSTEDMAIGDLIAVQSNGKVYHNAANASAPFQALEAIHGWVTADYWLWTKYLGNQA